MGQIVLILRVYKEKEPVYTYLYTQTKCDDMGFVHTNLYTQIMYIHNNLYTQRRFTMARDKRFSMRTDQVFRDNLEWLSKEMGLPKTQCVEIAVNLFPDLVRLYAKLEKQVSDIKDNL